MLTLEQRQQGRSRLLWFGFFNSLSFTLMTGNLVSLYLLRLGAGNGLIGVIAAFSYGSYFMLFVGRLLVPRVGVMQLFAWAWLCRYIAFLPALVAPIFLLQGSPTTAFILVGGGVLGFNISRGVGIVANAPMFSGFTGTNDRGRLLSQFQMIAAVVSIVVGLAVAHLLGDQAEIGRYVLFLGGGVAAGIVATGLLFAMPELDDEREMARRRLLPALREMLARPQMRRFFTLFLLVAISSGVGRTFLVVYAKQAQGYTDRLAFMMVAVGSVGSLLAGYLGSILLDRLGARPLILFSLGAYLVSIVTIIVLPVTTGIAVVSGVGVIFLLGTLGYTGNENSSQAYFYGITARDDRLNLGIIFYLILGLGGSIGSFAGGFLLDALAPFIGIVWAFRILFAITAVILVTALVRAGALESLGAETFRGTLEVIFSPRDLRTVGLLNRLERTRGPEEEQDAIRTIAHSGSGIATGDVIARLGSPSYAVRQEALEALSALPWTREVEDALIRHLAGAVHTTAFQAVRILGLRGSARAIEPVQRAITSADPMLADRATIAYARLAGAQAIPELRRLLSTVANPRALMHVAVAIQIAGSRTELPPLLRQLTRDALPDYVVDEILIAAAHLLGIHTTFYRHYSVYLREPDAATRATLAEELASSLQSPATVTRATATRAPDAALLGATDPVRLHTAITALILEDDPVTARDLLLSPPTLLPAEVASLAPDLPTRGRVTFFLLCTVSTPTVAGAPSLSVH